MLVQLNEIESFLKNLPECDCILIFKPKFIETRSLFQVVTGDVWSYWVVTLMFGGGVS